jgi:hypothetical protein
VYIGRLLHPLHPARRHEGDHSFGLFAAGFITEGSDIGYYCGKIMSEAEIDDEGELRAQGRYAIDFDLKDFPTYLQKQEEDGHSSESKDTSGDADANGHESTAHTAITSGTVGDTNNQSKDDSTSDAAMARATGLPSLISAAAGHASSANKAHRAGIVDHEVHMLVMDASLHRNEMAFMNDYRWAPLGDPPAPSDATTSATDGTAGGSATATGAHPHPWNRRPNVETYTSFQYFGSTHGQDHAAAASTSAGGAAGHGGGGGGVDCEGMWPCVVVRTTRDVMEGEELLWDVSDTSTCS